jgi:hypothetical protein
MIQRLSVNTALSYNHRRSTPSEAALPERSLSAAAGTMVGSSAARSQEGGHCHRVDSTAVGDAYRGTSILKVHSHKYVGIWPCKTCLGAASCTQHMHTSVQRWRTPRYICRALHRAKPTTLGMLVNFEELNSIRPSNLGRQPRSMFCAGSRFKATGIQTTGYQLPL